VVRVLSDHRAQTIGDPPPRPFPSPSARRAARPCRPLRSDRDYSRRPARRTACSPSSDVQLPPRRTNIASGCTPGPRARGLPGRSITTQFARGLPVSEGLAIRSPVTTAQQLLSKRNLVQTRFAHLRAALRWAGPTRRRFPARTVGRTTARLRTCCARGSAIRDCRRSSARHPQTEGGDGTGARPSRCSGLRARQRRSDRRRVH